MITVKRFGRHKRCWIAAEAVGHMTEFFMSLSPRVVPDPTDEQLRAKLNETEELLDSLPAPRRRIKREKISS